MKRLMRMCVMRLKGRAAAMTLIALLASMCLLLLLSSSGCRVAENALSVSPRSLRDVPAERLAFHFEPDVAAENLPETLKKEETDAPLATIKTEFETHRQTDALLRTVVSPEGQRALALYATSESEKYDYRVDVYASEGMFIRNVMPADMIGAFASEAAWSPDGQRIAFIAVKNPAAQASPTPPGDIAPAPDIPPPATGAPGETATPETTPTVAPLIQSVPVFSTEQIYVADRDGFQLKPLTTRQGLIYFQLAWSPDNNQLAALACKEDEWNARKAEGKPPAGRPRLITLDGKERLLDDRLTDVAPVWSPDGAKVATAFDYDVTVYDASGGTPTGASLPLREPLYNSSIVYDEQVLARKAAAADANPTPSSKKKSDTPSNNAAATVTTTNNATGERVVNSFNPFVRLEWVEPETIFAQTAFVRFYRNEPVPITTYPRWHVLKLSPQATFIKG